MKKFLLIISLMFLFTNVNAMQQTATSLSTDGNTVTSYLSIMPKYFYINQNSNLNYWVMPIYETKFDDPTHLYHTIILQFCSTNDFSVRLPNANGPATNLDFLKTDAKCTVYSANDGFWTLAYIDYPNMPKLPGFVDLYANQLNIILTGSTASNSTVILVNIYFADVNTYTRDILTVASGNSDALITQLSQSIINNQNTINNSINNQTNAINNQTNTINNQTNAINGINNTISDNNVDNPNSDISSFNSFVANNSTITNLLTLPITLFQKVLNSLNGTCTSYDLGELFGTHIIFPCINIASYIGSTLFNVIDVLISGLFVYKISRKFIKVFENMSSMKDGDVIND